MRLTKEPDEMVATLPAAKRNVYVHDECAVTSFCLNLAESTSRFVL